MKAVKKTEPCKRPLNTGSITTLVGMYTRSICTGSEVLPQRWGFSEWCDLEKPCNLSTSCNFPFLSTGTDFPTLWHRWLIFNFANLCLLCEDKRVYCWVNLEYFKTYYSTANDTNQSIWKICVLDNILRDVTQPMKTATMLKNADNTWKTSRGANIVHTIRWRRRSKHDAIVLQTCSRSSAQ